MKSPSLLTNGPKSAALTVVLAHGAGAPMDSPFMAYFAEGLAKAKYRVVRFEFPYMAARRDDDKKRPPDRQPVLLETWQAVIAKLAPGPLVIGGKSMGGRMASLIAADAPPSHVKGLVCLGYPFYGAGRKDKPRIDHLKQIKLPTLICQGTRDPMGDREAISGLTLPRNIRVAWAEDGNHDLSPRKASGRTQAQNWQDALDAVTAFLARLA
jgi:predicted alpha/beta-hydrolase family hydrolase